MFKGFYMIFTDFKLLGPNWTLPYSADITDSLEGSQMSDK